jgi:3-keto-L-gulonate-6-phosphate decarboxylase
MKSSFRGRWRSRERRSPGAVDYIEAGTPLIKSEGMNSVRALKENFGDLVIVADIKTMDTGAMEVEMAIKSGAGIVKLDCPPCSGQVVKQHAL